MNINLWGFGRVIRDLQEKAADAEEMTIILNTEHEVRDKHTMRAFNRNEITRFIKDNGFTIKSMYANSRKEPYTDFSNRILIHFVKE